MKTEQEMGSEIMDQVNTMTPAKEMRLMRDLSREAGSPVKYLNVRTISPLDMTVGIGDELGAYKLAYAYRDHFQSRVHVELAKGPAAADAGPYLVVLTPR
jgi:hypothetical protein